MRKKRQNSTTEQWEVTMQLWKRPELLIIILAMLLLAGTSAAQPQSPPLPADSIIGPEIGEAGQTLTFSVTTKEPGQEFRITDQPQLTAVTDSDAAENRPWIYIAALESDGECSIDDQGSLVIIVCQTTKFHIAFFGHRAQRLYMSTGEAKKETFINGPTPTGLDTRVWLHGTDQSMLKNDTGHYAISIYNTTEVTRTYSVSLFLLTGIPHHEALSIVMLPTGCIVPIVAATETSAPQALNAELLKCSYSVAPGAFDQREFDIRWLYPALHTLQVNAVGDDGIKIGQHTRDFSIFEVTPYPKMKERLWLPIAETS